MKQTAPRMSIVIPAYNAELTIRDVMVSFHRQLPGAKLVVVDNASTDNTSEISKTTETGLQERTSPILREIHRGKAGTVKRASRNIDADIYVMVDADMTHPASALQSLLQSVPESRTEGLCTKLNTVQHTAHQYS